MRYPLLLIGLIFSATLLAQNPLGFGFQDDREYVELSFREESNLIVVPIKLNGEGPFNFILDTGSESGMIFDRWVIGENNLVNARKIPIYAKDGGKITDLLVANGINVEMTGISGSDQSMLVLKNNDIDTRNILGVEAHGVLGSELFNRFVVEIDYEEEKLRLYEPSSFEAPKGYKKVDILVENFRPYIRSSIKQKRRKPLDVNLLVDSGASSALFLDYEKHENIDLPDKTIEHTLGSSLAGDLEGKVGRVRKIKVAKGVRFNNVVTSFPRNWEINKTIQTEDGALTRHGTLGSDILCRFNVVFDYLHNAMYLKVNEKFKEPFSFNNAGFTFAARGKDLSTFYISKVIKNSLAELKGLQVGDEIISIDGKPIFFYSFSEINSLIRGPSGTKMSIIIQRKGELFKKILKLKKII